MAGKEPEVKTITREQVEQRLATLRVEHEQAKANLHAYEGAIADCEYWLKVLEESSRT